MKKIYLYLALFFSLLTCSLGLATNEHHIKKSNEHHVKKSVASTESGSNLSQAINYAGGLSVSVDPHTELLNLKFPLASLSGKNNASLALTLQYGQYSQYKQSDLNQLGKAWSFSWDQIDATVNSTLLDLASGSKYKLENCNALPSGQQYQLCSVKYYKLKDILVYRVNPNYTGLPSDLQGKNVTYIFRGLTGDKEYFDGQGRLLRLENKYNDQINWSYNAANISIVDSYNHLITITQTATGYQIGTPDKRTITLNVSNIGDPNQAVSEIDVNAGSGSSAISKKYKINYTNDLIKSIQYPTSAMFKITYINEPGNINIQRVQSTTLCANSDGSNCRASTNYYLGDDQHNFMGYNAQGDDSYPNFSEPTYNQDPVAELLPNYQYTTVIKTDKLITENIYNHLHQLRSTTTKGTAGTLLRIVKYQYPCDLNQTCGDAPDQLDANYGKPTTITTQDFNPKNVQQSHILTVTHITYDSIAGNVLTKKESLGNQTLEKDKVYDGNGFDPNDPTYSAPDFTQKYYDMLTQSTTTATTDKSTIINRTLYVLQGDPDPTTTTHSNPKAVVLDANYHKRIYEKITYAGISTANLQPENKYIYGYDDKDNFPNFVQATQVIELNPNDQQDFSNFTTKTNIKNENGKLTLTTLDPLQHETQKIYDIATGSLLQNSALLANGQTLTASYAYDPLGRISQKTSPNGNVVNYIYCDTVTPDNPTNLNVCKDDTGVLNTNTIIINSSRGYQKKQIYNNLGQLTKIYDNHNRNQHSFDHNTFYPIQTITYNQDGLQDQAIDEINNVSQTYGYNDPFNRPTSVTTAQLINGVPDTNWSSMSVYQYTDFDQDGNYKPNKVTNVYFDKNLKPEKNDTSLTATGLFDELGRVKSQQIAGQLGNTLTLARPLKQDTSPSSTTTAYTYNASSQVFNTSTTNAFNTAIQYQPNGRMASATTTDQSPVASLTGNFSYNMLGQTTQTQLSQVVDNKTSTANTEIYHYNPVGEITKITDSDGNHPITYTYTNLGEVAQETLLNGDVKYYAYNTTSREIEDTCYAKQGTPITTNNCNDRNAWDHIHYTHYDATKPALKDLLQSVSAQGSHWDTGINKGTIQYSYYDDGRLKTLQYPDGKSITYEYDAQDRIQSMTDVNGLTTNYHYDQFVAGQYVLSSVTNSQGNEIDYGYYHSGRLKSILRKNKTTDTTGITTTYTYNALGNVETIEDTDAAGKVIVDQTYHYDASDNVHTKTLNSPSNPNNSLLNYTDKYTYTLHRLTNVTRTVGGVVIDSTTYDYDPLGNIIGVKDKNILDILHYNTLDQLTDINKDKKLTWNNGDLTNDDQGNTYTFNGINELVGYQNATTQLTETYTYYLNGLRASRSQNKININYYYNADDDLVSEISGNDQVSYFNQAARIVDNNTNWYLYNLHGSVIDYINGTQNQFYDYTPFGEIKGQNNSSNGLSIQTNPLQYNGEYTDAISNLIYLKARYYNPRLKLFISRDTTNVINRYAFADGNPIMNIDPTGCFSWGSFFSTVFQIGAALLTDGMSTVASIAANTAIAVAGQAIEDAIDHKHVSVVGMLETGAMGGAFAGPTEAVTDEAANSVSTSILDASVETKTVQETMTADEARSLFKLSNPGLTGSISDPEMINAIGAAYPEMQEELRPGLLGGVKTRGGAKRSYADMQGSDDDDKVSDENYVDEPEPPLPEEYETNTRPGYAKGQEQAVWDAAVAKNPSGKVFDPNKTDKELFWDKGKPRKGQWDMGHKYGYEYKKLYDLYSTGKISKPKFYKAYRDPNHYEPEFPSGNQSHAHEAPASVNYYKGYFTLSAAINNHCTINSTYINSISIKNFDRCAYAVG